MYLRPRLPNRRTVAIFASSAPRNCRYSLTHATRAKYDGWKLGPGKVSSCKLSLSETPETVFPGTEERAEHALAEAEGEILGYDNYAETEGTDPDRKTGEYRLLTLVRLAYCHHDLGDLDYTGKYSVE
jgi:hypothetical protein